MIAKYSNLCSICGVRIPAGVDVQYNGDAKTIAHWECVESPKPTSAEFELAERLGFIGPDDPFPASWRTWKVTHGGKPKQSLLSL